MSWTEIEIDESGRITVRRGGTLTGDTGTRSGDTLQPLLDRLAETGEIEAEPEPMAEAEPDPEPEPIAEPEPEPKPKLVTWRLCAQIEQWQIDTQQSTAIIEWYPSGGIPENWYPIEAQSQPVKTVKQLPEDQRP